MSTTHIPALPHAAHGVPTRLIVSLAAGAGFSVASIYYSQPMLGVISGGLGSSEQATGMVPTLTSSGTRWASCCWRRWATVSIAVA